MYPSSCPTMHEHLQPDVSPLRALWTLLSPRAKTTNRDNAASLVRRAACLGLLHTNRVCICPGPCQEPEHVRHREQQEDRHLLPCKPLRRTNLKDQASASYFARGRRVQSAPLDGHLSGASSRHLNRSRIQGSMTCVCVDCTGI